MKVKTLLGKIPLINTVWFFPILATILLLLLTAFKIHGSSIGVYDELLRSDSSNRNLFGNSRTIRSDEWYVNTPFILSQKENGFPVINNDVGSGQDMSVVIDVPYAEWSVLFKPQNLVFFILPLEYAFAFKWWFLIWLLFIAVYFLVLTISPKKYTRASLLAIFLCFSPFVQWWYQSITILPIAYSLLLVAVAIKTIRLRSLRNKILAGLFIAYLAACFILIMYPAFQIICALIGIGIFTGIVLDKKLFKQIIGGKVWIIYLGSAFTACLIATLFIIAHQSSIQTITETAYPGARSIEAGGMQIASMLQWPLGYVPLRSLYAEALGANQSEASRFLFFGLLLIPYLLRKFLKKVPVKKLAKSVVANKDKLLFFIMTGLTVLICLRMFLPIGSGAYKLLGLHLVPHIRLVIGLGIINIIILAIALNMPTKKWRDYKSIVDWSAFGVAGYSGFLVLISTLYVDRVYQVESVGIFETLAIATSSAVVVGLIAHSIMGLRYIGLALACLASFIISFPVNPISQGIGAIKTSELSNYIKKEERKNDSYWITAESNIFSPLPLAAGAEVFSGVHTYPQLTIWQKYFPEQTDIFNRYAHIRFTLDESQADRSLRLIQGDSFEIITSSCDPMLKDLNIGYILTSGDSPDKYRCFGLEKTFIYNTSPISIYRRITDVTLQP